MKIKTIGVSDVPSMMVELKKSMKKYEIDNEIIYCAWRGFYTKINEAYKYCKKHLDLDYILFVDAHDVIFVNRIEPIEVLILKYFKQYDCVFSVEKACWPDASLADKYPECDTPWKYLNSGSYLFKPQKLIDYVDRHPIEIGMDDQLYFTNMFLSKETNCKLDTDCKIFQSIAFESEGEFSIDNGFHNNVTNSNPIILHGNGKTNMDKYYNL
jgi:hypothetical protein